MYSNWINVLIAILMKLIKIIYACFLIIFTFFRCKTNNDQKTDIYQNQRETIINVKNNINDIETKFIIGYPGLCIVDTFLIVTDNKNSDKGIHIFNKNTFKFLRSTGTIGRGPGEIGRYGEITTDKNNKRMFWMSDYGKQVMWRFNLDSVLKNDKYKPSQGINFGLKFFMIRYEFLNDSIILGKALEAINDNSYVEHMAKLNINTNRITKYGYMHPEAVGKKSRSGFTLSLKNNVYINTYFFSDLLTICNLDGSLKRNIYGPHWHKNKKNKIEYFGRTDIINNNIIVAYNGEVGFFINKFKRPESNNATKFMVFDLDGNYKKTIETGHHFIRFCIDEEKSRVIVYFEDKENPLSYFTINTD